MAELTPGTSSAAAAAEKDRLRALFLLAITPAILLVGWIKHYAVNVPFGDEWALVPLFEKWHNGQLTFADLYQQHNEHRILVSKLIQLAFARLTRWNLRAEMFFSVALCAGASAAIYGLLRRTLGGSARQLLLLWAAANLVIFSPTQAQNWLWGFQFQMFVPNLCLVTTLLILTSDWRWWPTFALSALLIAVATFSFGNGLLLWPVIALFLMLRGENKRRIAAWLLVFAVVVGLYFRGYYRVANPQPLTGWLDYIEYALAFIGGGLARGRDGQLLFGALAIGAVALAVYAAACVHFFRTRGEALRNAAPWLALGPYVIGSAALTACSRVNWGPRQAIDSRYVTVSNYLHLSLIVLAAIAVRYTAPFAKVLRATKPIIVTGIVVLALAAIPDGLEEMALLHRRNLAGLGALQLSKVIDTTESLRRDLWMLPGFVPSPRESVATLEHLHLLHTRRRGSAVLEDDARRPNGTPSEFGMVDELKCQGQMFEISGWAVLPEAAQPAPLVVLAYRDADRWVGFSLCDVGEFRGEAVAKRHSRDYQASRWRKPLDRRSLPARAERISAWAVDPSTRQVHKLAGDYSLPSL